MQKSDTEFIFKFLVWNYTVKNFLVKLKQIG